MTTQLPEEDIVTKVQFNEADLRLALRDSNEFFINFAIPEQLTLDVPQFHVELVDLNTNPQATRQAIAVPRDHAKTTMVKVAIAKKIFYTKRRFFVYCTDTGPVAKGAIRDIVNIISQDNFKQVFGDVTWEKKNDSEGLYIGQVKCWANLDKPYDKTIVIKALGSGQQVRGLNIDNQRPDDLTIDDAENDEIVNTEEQREKFKTWIFATLIKACSTTAGIIYIGNLIDNRCLLVDLLKDPDWYAVRYGCIKTDGTPLWPQKFSIEYLSKEFQQFKRIGKLARWFAEMMNLPMPEGLAIIKVDEIEFRSLRNPGDLQLGFIVIDPAISKKTSSDLTSLTVHGLVEDKWQIVEHSFGRFDPIQTLWEMVRLCNYWGINLVGIESTAFQASLQHLYPILLNEYKIHNINIVPLDSVGRKVERIVGWASWLKDHSYTLNENEHHILVQLLAYDVKKDDNEDDIIDSASYGPQMISKYMGMMTVSLDMTPVKIQDSADVCSV